MSEEEFTPLLVSIKDTYGLVYYIYFIYGIAMLLPWNVFITASEYFAMRFADTVYKDTFQNYFSTYYTLSNLMTYIVILLIQQKLFYRFSPLKSILLNTMIFGLLAITVHVEMKGSYYFWCIMISIVITGGATSFFQNAVFSEASQLPPIYTQAVLSGQGLAGVFVAFSSISSMMVGQRVTSAFLYFLSAFLITLAALLGRLLIVHLPFYRHHMETPLSSTSDHKPVKWISVIQKISGQVFSVSYVFIVTILVFPSITSLVQSTQQNAFFVALHFLLFNVGDWIGRMMPFRILKTRHLVLLAILRTLFVPLFLVCNVVVAEKQLPIWIQNDMLYFGLLFTFAVSSGWVCSLSMMSAPQLTHTAAEKSMAGSIMSFSLVAGLAIGGSLSFITRWMV